MKGGPYWHVIRFLDHPLLPANTPRDVPKIVKHGIDDDGPMHPKSPHISAPDGVVTLLYKMGREDWMRRFLDVEGTHKFELVLRYDGPYEDFYVDRKGRDVEIGFLGTSRTSTPIPEPGVRYRVQTSGEWTPISTSDLGNGWGGTPLWVRAEGETLAKSIWFHTLWERYSVVSIDWTGITDAEKENRPRWEEQTNEAEGQETGDNSDEGRTSSQKVYNAKWKECRGGCGERNAKLVCGRCKETHYCSLACQREDWKYHKSVCGKDLHDPQ